MRRDLMFAGGGFVAGKLVGLALAALMIGRPGAAQGPDSAAPASGAMKYHRVQVDGNPENVARLYGYVASDGCLKWLPSRQKFEPRPAIECASSSANAWVTVRINGDPVTVWGWTDAGYVVDGHPRWCLSDQRFALLDADASAGATRPPPDVPKGGVVAAKLDGKPTVRASDPAEAAKVQVLMESGVPNRTKPEDCDPPQKIPLPSLSRGIGVGWWEVAKWAGIGLAALVGVVATLAAVLVSVWSWRRGR